MNKKLFIGGLSFSSTEDSIKEAFGQCGTVVAVTIITDKFSGRPKGFGFVEMSSDEEAKAAIEMWDTKELDGRTIHVNEARPMEDRGPARN
jgi:cold-inducible RNA-binding protein